MPKATYHFPRGFMWGTASAAHQVEGDNTNNQWWDWEQTGHTKGTSGRGCDWWGGRWREDFDRAAASGQNALRLSVEWSRIQPAPNRWDEFALDHYRDMLRGLRERGLVPMVTLHHFTDPLWVHERGAHSTLLSVAGQAWENSETPALFAKFVRKTVESLKDFCSLWCTINEPNVYAFSGYAHGAFPPGVNDLKRAIQVQANLLRGHAAAYRIIHEIQPRARVGYALHYRPMVPKRAWFPLDRLMRNIRHEGINMAFPSGISTGIMKTPVGNIAVPEAKGTQDYLGLNYYSQDTISFNISNRKELFTQTSYPPDADFSDTKFIANIPEGFYASIKWAARAYPSLPILVTENGVECADDHLRRRYLAQHIHQMWRAVNFNWPVQGYFHWSLVDNFEWERGWTQRFGLWSLDPETQQRAKRPSADLYADICNENGLSSDMVQKYCPEVFEKLFPS